MATLALSLAGQVVGGAVGGPIGATIGRALGALAGSAIDSAIFAEAPAATAGSDLQLQGSSEGAPIPKLYGWSRLSGNIIWATQLERLDAATAGAKGTSQSTDTAEPQILANFAVGLCEGEVQRLGRIWADGELLDTSGLTLRFYRGTETQGADSLIEAKQGGDAPAYRGLCYIVFERLPLASFGNRIPNISVELCRVVGELEPMIRAITVIPGATEFGYDPVPRVRLAGAGRTVAENTHLAAGVSDWTLSIDELVAMCPNLEQVSLVIAWFGDDLRAAHCTIAPRVEAASRTVKGTSWSVAGLGRGDVEVVSSHDGGPAYGGTPSDGAVLAAIADLKARGIGVTLYPIVLMDIAEGNAFGQPAYPWRGHIGVSPGADGTAAAAAEIAAFTASYSDFILHYATLAQDAGGVDGFIIGSELRGLTFARGAANSFPFVAALVTLAADMRPLLGDATVTYAADWSEYAGLQPGGGAKFFHLDPLWASENIDAVGIDNYMPLADWRDGAGPDAADWDGPYDLSYLRANIAGGEGFDWYYASGADRIAGTRTPITDAAYGEPWVWRFKDLVGWWSHAHHDRPGGVHSGSATAWVPKGKPIWLTELGCGAVDKAANQPNVFGDVKSAESALPYFSTGAPDPLAQRQALRAVLGYWADPANNPLDDDGHPMLMRATVWTWDARPFPAFPSLRSVWSDGDNYATGHWLTGRLGVTASDELARAVAADFGVSLAGAEAWPPLVHGYVVEAPMTARTALEPVLSAAGLAVHDTAEGLMLARATGRDPLPIGEIVAAEGPLLSRRRPDPGEAVGQVALSYADRERSFLSGSVTAIAAAGGPLESVASGLVLDLAGARSTAERLLAERLARGDSVEFTAPPSLLALEVGDVIAVGETPFEITEIRDGLARKIVGRAVAPQVVATVAVARPGTEEAPSPEAAPVVDFAHLPPAIDDLSRTRLATGAFAEPWPGTVSVTDDRTGAGLATLAAEASLGELTAPLVAGSIFVWDMINAVELMLYAGHLSSRDDDEVLAGANRIAVQTDAGDWEVLGFASAELTAPGAYRLARLLRGQMGTDAAIGACAAGNAVLVLDTTASLLPVPAAWLETTAELRSFAGPADAAGTLAEVPIGLGPMQPLAPVHLKAERVAGGDVALTWKRRSRSDPDSWATNDAPLDGVPEAYRLTIFNGLVPVRTVDTLSSAATYTASQQSADFGSLPSGFSYSVAQLSPLYGPGHARTALFTA